MAVIENTIQSYFFEKVVANRISKIHELIKTKGVEYATDDDRFHNFKRSAAILGVSPERALIGMVVKHITSVLDMIDKVDQNYIFNTEMIDQKIGDVIIYFILLEALFLQRVSHSNRPAE